MDSSQLNLASTIKLENSSSAVAVATNTLSWIDAFVADIFIGELEAVELHLVIQDFLDQNSGSFPTRGSLLSMVKKIRNESGVNECRMAKDWMYAFERHYPSKKGVSPLEAINDNISVKSDISAVSVDMVENLRKESRRNISRLKFEIGSNTPLPPHCYGDFGEEEKCFDGRCGEKVLSQRRMSIFDEVSGPCHIDEDVGDKQMRAMAAVLSGSVLKSPSLSSLKKELLQPFLQEFESYKRRGGPHIMVDCLSTMLQNHLREMSREISIWDLSEVEVRHLLLRKFRSTNTAAALASMTSVVMDSSPTFEETVFSRYVLAFRFEMELCQLSLPDKTYRNCFLQGFRPSSLADILRSIGYSSLDALIEGAQEMYTDNRVTQEKLASYKREPRHEQREVKASSSSSVTQIAVGKPTPAPATTTPAKSASELLCYRCYHVGHKRPDCTTPLDKFNTKEVGERLLEKAMEKYTCAEPETSWSALCSCFGCVVSGSLTSRDGSSSGGRA